MRASEIHPIAAIPPVRRFEVLVARFFFAGIRKLHHAGAAAAGRAS